MVQSFSLSSGFLCFPSSPYASHRQKLGERRHFCFDLLHHRSFETQQENKGSRLCCVLPFLLMQVSAVVFKPTSGPLAAPEGKITYIALTS